jgi:hypothetical protein
MSDFVAHELDADEQLMQDAFRSKLAWVNGRPSENALVGVYLRDIFTPKSPDDQLVAIGYVDRPPARRSQSTSIDRGARILVPAHAGGGLGMLLHRQREAFVGEKRS